jgi:hypothetical protein
MTGLSGGERTIPYTAKAKYLDALRARRHDRHVSQTANCDFKAVVVGEPARVFHANSLASLSPASTVAA